MHGRGRGQGGLGRGSHYQGGRGRGNSGAVGRSTSRSRKDCLDYKLLGHCRRNEAGECWFSHTNKESNPPSEIVMIPDKIPMSTAVNITLIQRLRSTVCECSLKPASSNSIEIVVAESNASQLPKLKVECDILLSQLYPIGPGWCYIHRDGVERCETGSLLKFRIYEGRIPLRPGGVPFRERLLELCIADEAEESDGASKLKIEVMNPPRETETAEGLQRAINRAHGGKKKHDSNIDVGVKIINNHEDHMKDMLEGGLKWFCDKKRGRRQFVLKLEARFGKILWKNIPEDFKEQSFKIEQFANLCFDDTKHSITFSTDVKQQNAGAVKELGEKISLLETFDIKFTVPNSKERNAIDIRVKFEDGHPKLLFARKNEAKVVIFNILCLHREHDIRISLNYFEMMNADPTDPEYKLVEQLMKTLSLSDPNEGIISLVARAQDWNVNFIRHKKRETYNIDDKYIVTVTDIRECQLKQQPQNEKISVKSDWYVENHTELEVHNCSWEHAFGRDVGLSPDRCLILHMEDPSALPEIASASPRPWQPEDILGDFQEFCENLDIINETLGTDQL